MNVQMTAGFSDTTEIDNMTFRLSVGSVDEDGAVHAQLYAWHNELSDEDSFVGDQEIEVEHAIEPVSFEEWENGDDLEYSITLTDSIKILAEAWIEMYQSDDQDLQWHEDGTGN